MTRRFLSAIAAAAILLATPAFAQTTPWSDMPAGVYLSDQSHTSVTFKVSHLGLSNYTARFAKAEAQLTLDPADPQKSRLTATVDPASVRTDYPNPQEKDFDHKLATDENWFNAGTFPAISFTATKIEKTGANTGRVTGDLAFLGVTKPVTLDVTFNGAYDKAPFSEKAALGFSAHTRLKRSDFGMTQYAPQIGDDVEIIIETEFHRKDAAQ